MPYINAKIYSDGGHYIAIPKENFPSEQRRRKTPKPKQLEIKKDDSPPTRTKENTQNNAVSVCSPLVERQNKIKEFKEQLKQQLSMHDTVRKIKLNSR